MVLVKFLKSKKNKEVARCFHGYRNYAPHSDIARYQNLCTIASSPRICIQISLAYPALPNWHFQILPLYYKINNKFTLRTGEYHATFKVMTTQEFSFQHPLKHLTPEGTAMAASSSAASSSAPKAPSGKRKAWKRSDSGRKADKPVPK